MSYDAVAVSSTDLSAGPDFMLQSRDQAFPWVSANITDSEGKTIFSPYIIKNLKNLSIGIIGLTGPSLTQSKYFQIIDWKHSLQTQLTQLGDKCDILLVLSNLPDKDNKSLTRDFPEIDMIISGISTQGNVSARVFHNSLITQTVSRGKYLGKLNIDWQNDGKWKTDSSQSLQHLKNKLKSIDKQIETLKQQQGTNQALSKKIARMQSYKKTIISQIEAEELSVSARHSPSAENRYASSFVPVRPTNSKSSVTSIVQQTKAKINSYNKSRKNSSNIPNIHIGISACKKCHEEQFNFWTTTSHSKAYATLKKDNQSHNPDCLPCHVTSGNVLATSPEKLRLSLLALPGELKTIGCEVCHGPTKAHLESSADINPQRLPLPGICNNCHTPERDDNFNYLNKLQLIACPSN